MNRLVLPCVCACLLLPLAAGAQKPEADCFDKAVTQLDLNDCAGKQYQEADAELNRVYKAILEKYKEDKLFVEKLRAAQRAWLAYRDAEIEAKYPHAGEAHYYGSIFPMCDSLYQAQLTQERIKKLREWLDGGEEGDACGGSVD
jgi:uncharacterized protein YecT (DUF1311 family)